MRLRWRYGLAAWRQCWPGQLTISLRPLHHHLLLEAGMSFQNAIRKSRHFSTPLPTRPTRRKRRRKQTQGSRAKGCRHARELGTYWRPRGTLISVKKLSLYFFLFSLSPAQVGGTCNLVNLRTPHHTHERTKRGLASGGGPVRLTSSSLIIQSLFLAIITAAWRNGGKRIPLFSI